MSRWDLFLWVYAPGASLVAIAATTVSFLKGRRVWSAIGALASLVAIAVTVSAWTADGESWGDLQAAAGFLLFVLPLTAVAAVGALQHARPDSWWASRRIVGAEPPTVAGGPAAHL